MLPQVNFSESPGLYYNDTGRAQVYSTKWKVVSYVDFEEANQNLETKEVCQIINIFL
jgi:hypothetical protein